MNQAKVEKIKNNSEKLIRSNWFLLIFLLLVVFSSILSITLFLNGKLTIKTPWVNEISNTSDYLWLAYLQFALALSGSISSLIGYALSIRWDKRYLYFSVLGALLIIGDAIILGAVFTAIADTFLIMVSIISYKKFSKSSDEEQNTSMMNKKYWIYSLIFFICYVVIFLPLTYKFIYNDLSSTRDILSGLVDVFCSVGLILAWFIVLKKSKWGFWIFIVVDIIYMIFFASAGDFAGASSFIGFIGIEIVALIFWSSNEKLEEMKNNEAIKKQ